MSDYERNKGRLVPTGIDTSNWTDNDWDDAYENNLVRIDGEMYLIEYEVKDDRYGGFADVKLNEDGSVDFHTYHYNGGGSLSEVIQDALRRVGGIK